jgi:hypothetical protein
MYFGALVGEYYVIGSNVNSVLSQKSDICVVNRVRAGRAGIWIPVGARELFLLRQVDTGFGGHTASYSMDTAVPFRG